MRNRNRVFFMQAEQHLWLHIAEIIDQAVVQSPITRAWIQRDERNLQCAERFRDDIAAEQCVSRGPRQRPFDWRARSIGELIYEIGHASPSRAAIARMLCMLVNVPVALLSI